MRYLLLHFSARNRQQKKDLPRRSDAGEQQKPGLPRRSAAGANSGGTMTKRFARFAPALVLVACQFTLYAQSPAPQSRQNSSSWADDIIKKEGYVTPPPEVADAVLAPRHLNVNLSSAS